MTLQKFLGIFIEGIPVFRCCYGKWSEIGVQENAPELVIAMKVVSSQKMTKHFPNNPPRLVIAGLTRNLLLKLFFDSYVFRKRKCNEGDCGSSPQ